MYKIIKKKSVKETLLGYIRGYSLLDLQESPL